MSDSAKLGPISTTGVAQQSCPTTCPFLRHGCYAENGFTGMLTKQLNRAQPGTSALDLARLEAAVIDLNLSGTRDLRLHSVGDSTTLEGTIMIAEAVERYIERGRRAGLPPGRPRVWAYTHAWRDVPRWAWGPVSILASCETPGDVMEARARGYATALVVDRHPDDRLYEAGPLRVLPCPEQTRGVTCSECGLCSREDYLASRGVTIGFAAHGGRGSKAAALRTLAVQRARRARMDGRAADGRIAVTAATHGRERGI